MDELLFRRVADDLDRLIESGHYPPDTRLPSQRKLAEDYGVAEGTVREALSVLQARGRVVVRPKSGTYVRGREMRQRLVINVTLSRNDLGYLFTGPAGHWVPIGMPTRDRVACPDEVAGELQLATGAQVWTRRRVVGIADREPMLITTTYLHPVLVERVPAVTAEDTGPGGWIDRVEFSYGGPVRVVTSHYSRPPTGQESDSLWIPPTQGVLVELRRIFAPGADVVVDAPLAVDLVVRDETRWEVRAELARDESATWPVTPATARNTPR